MIIAITGSTGFIGRRVKTHFVKKGMKVISVPRDFLYDKNAILKQLQGVDVIIHLAGYPITKRWTAKNKRKIYESRAITTQNIVEAINKMDKPPSTLISTSAVGLYNNIHYHDESSEDFATNFLGDICLAWEAPMLQINQEHTRTIITRLGVILGRDGGLIKQLLPIFKLGLGGKIGHGEYAMPFIHILDLIRFYDEAVSNENYQGIYNLVAPHIITNEEFTHALANALNKKARFKIPVFALKLLFGKGIMTVINNPIVIPKQLLQAGYKYEYDQINEALEQIISEQT
jgi:uncharacterized protein (TIGR01777 family)